MGNALVRAPQHTALNPFEHDGVDRVPGQRGEFTHFFGVGAGLQQSEHEGLHEQCDACVALSPGHGQLLHRAIAVLELGHARLYDGFKLAGVQVPPLASLPAVDVGSGLFVGGVCPHLALF